MKKIFTIDHGTYPFDVVFALNKTTEEIRKYLRRQYGLELTKEEIERLECPGRGRTVLLEGNQTILRVMTDTSHKKDSWSFYALLFHEIFHAVEFLFFKAGIEHHPQYSSEAYAYQIQYLTENILSKLDQ